MKELIELAEEKGFKSECIFNIQKPDLDYSIELTDFFLMCELQKWLMETHGLYAYIDWSSIEGIIIDHKNFAGKELFRMDTHVLDSESENEVDYLPPLLFEALKLID